MAARSGDATNGPAASASEARYWFRTSLMCSRALLVSRVGEDAARAALAAHVEECSDCRRVAIAEYVSRAVPQ